MARDETAAALACSLHLRSSRLLQIVRDQLLRRLDLFNQLQKFWVAIHVPGSNIVDEPAPA